LRQPLDEKATIEIRTRRDDSGDQADSESFPLNPEYRGEEQQKYSGYDAYH
jgi:hypothetical protein